MYASIRDISSAGVKCESVEAVRGASQSECHVRDQMCDGQQ